MESKVRIILGILLVSFTCYQVECASVHHFRSARDVEFPANLNASVTDTTVSNKDVTSTTQSSPSTQDKISKDADRNVNKIETKGVDSTENESIKSSVEEKPIVSRGSVKFHSTDEKSEQINKENNQQQTTKANEKSENKQEKDVNKSEEPKVTGRSLNIDIEKYVSPEFHNKNNVYSLPMSPEIEKYIDSDSEEFSEDATKPSTPRRVLTTKTDFNTDLTTPQSNIFDTKFQMLVDGIKQNLDEFATATDQDDNEKSKFDSDSTVNYDDVSKLIDNYNNADNETGVALQTKEYKNIEIKGNKNTGNKDVESGKSVDYESTRLKSRTYDEKPENSDVPAINKITDNQEVDSEKRETILQTTSKPTSTTFVPSKRPRFQVSLRNNTIETTASESEVKPKSIKHFTYESTSLNPLYEKEKPTYSQPIQENAINISKRGSTKFVGTSDISKSTTANFMDYDNKNFSIPPTASAWTLVSMKDVPDNSNEQNSQENNLVKIQLTPSTKKEVTSSTENYLTSTTKFYKISSTTGVFYNSKDNVTTTDVNDEVTTTTEDNTTNPQTENVASTTFTEFSTTDSFLLSSQNDEPSEHTEESTEHTTFNFKTTFKDEMTTEFPSTEMSTIETDTTFKTETESQEFTTEFNDKYGTAQPITNQSTESSASTISIKFYPTITETENELFTTSRPVTINNISETNDNLTSTSTSTTKTMSSTVPSQQETEDDNFEDDYSEVIKKEKNTTDSSDSDIEIVSIDNAKQGSQQTWTTKKMNATTTPISVFKDQEEIVTNNNDLENTTVDTTSSTDMLSHDEASDDSNSGMIAAIAISSVGGVCLIILAGLLLIMRKRQKRVTYGQRCRPVSLDAYSLDNVSVYNSVRRKGALRASKRSYGNPAFDDPASISHPMNFQVLVKFAENVEGMSSEFDEIPQVTARANEVPQGCETKNRYANVIPLPETRVFLKASDNDPHSDYINANYVTGPKNTRGYYIACQAPMQNTVDDFWRMIWEQQCRVVLMLTNLYENGIEKCADYLPPSEVLDCHRLFGDFQITLKKREVKEKYIISCLQLKNMVSNSWREVTHLWYLGWPERGVPTEANSLIAFLIEARSHLKTASNNNSSNDKTNESSNMYISNAAGSANGSTPDGGPMVVHCSPGTGRTGTVIACDIAIRDFELTRVIDVPKIVYRVRRDRASAVQTRDQYAFIYKVISLYATKLTGGALDPI